ncbi:MAG: thioredoxin domain-containing protein [Myxococcota bacterium]
MAVRPPVFVLPLLLALACDQPTEEELRSMMEEVASSKVDAAKAEAKELQDKAAADAEAAGKRISSLETQIAEQSAQTVALESQLAEALGRLDKIEDKVDKPSEPLRPGRPDPALVYKATVDDAQFEGPADALVTIVTWSDFQCPYCKRVSPTIAQLRRDYGSDIRYAFKHNPLAFHNNARSAAIAAEAAGEQGKFWEMHDLLFENNRDLSDANYKKWARKLGLDMAQFKKDLASPTIAARVDAHQKEGVQLGARGTPSFFVNGRFLSGAQPAASFKTLIDEEMTKARAKVAAGTPRSGVYAATIASAKTAP